MHLYTIIILYLRVFVKRKKKIKYIFVYLGAVLTATGERDPDVKLLYSDVRRICRAWTWNDTRTRKIGNGKRESERRAHRQTENYKDDNQVKRVCKLACERANADCSTSVSTLLKHCTQCHCSSSAARKEYILPYPSYISGELNISELARVCDMSRTRVYRYIKVLK